MFSNMTVLDLVEGIKQGKFTSEEVVKYFIAVAEQKKDNNAVIEVFADALDRAKEIDLKISKGEKVGKLAGVPVALSDNILVKGKYSSCASNFLSTFLSPYSATVVEKLLSEDAVIFARTNMDEFSMGVTTENSIYGATKNAVNPSLVAGGSNGGAVVAVASGICPVAIASDAEGNMRQPASFNGVVAIKPTAGTVSRFGTMASSMEQIAPITKTIEENEYVLKAIAGKDFHDATTINNSFTKEDKIAKVGLVKEVMALAKDNKEFNDAINKLKAKGIEFVEVEVPHFDKALACYYVVSSAEATSNLAKFDGIKSSKRSKNITDLESVYILSRSEGFGLEAKRRVMMGNFFLSKENYNIYFSKASKVIRVVAEEINKVFDSCDIILLPTTLTEAFKVGERTDSVSQLKEGLFTVPASIAGIPSLTIPVLSRNNLPLGLQLCGAKCSEDLVYSTAKEFEKLLKEEK